MDWEIFQLWHNYLLNTEYKDNLIDKGISEFSRVLTDHKNGFSDFTEAKQNITKYEWKKYGKINNILNKLKIKFNINLELPRTRCKTSQKFNRKFDVQTGMMYNIPADLNGINTCESSYFYIPIHKTRRHIHGVPNDFLESYVLNMIETADWEKQESTYYYERSKIHLCAIYKCPEKYCIKNIKSTNQKNQIEYTTITKSCDSKINVFLKLIELQKYFNINEKIRRFFIKKITDNFRTNFPKKSRYITYCVGSCIHTNGYIHNGIPNGKQKCYDCKITYCRECGKSPYHRGELCKYTEEIPFENPENYRKCPGCYIWIEREEGCAHIRCPCGVHFCYQCRSVLCANDPYFHICRAKNPDPHFRDFTVNHPSVQYDGEIACNCKNCI